jgi:hypothetical protein
MFGTDWDTSSGKAPRDQLSPIALHMLMSNTSTVMQVDQDTARMNKGMDLSRHKQQLFNNVRCNQGNIKSYHTAHILPQLLGSALQHLMKWARSLVHRSAHTSTLEVGSSDQGCARCCSVVGRRLASGRLSRVASSNTWCWVWPWWSLGHGWVVHGGWHAVAASWCC